MRITLTGAAAAALLLLAPLTAIAGEGDKVTGGGQILFATKGAGNQIAFTAQQKGSEATGQIQTIDRSGGKGRAQVKFHGVVDCIEADGTMAKVGGHKKGGTQRFTLLVQDNGQGAAADPDMIAFKKGDAADPTCEPGDDDDDGLMALGRGNAQVRDGQGGSSGDGGSTGAPGLALPALPTP
jgi:hypothetical protein